MAIRFLWLFMVLIVGQIWCKADDATSDYLRKPATGSVSQDDYWKNLKDDYRYRSIQPKKQVPRKRTRKTPETIPTEQNNPAIWSWQDIVRYVLVFALLTMILYLIVRYGKFNWQSGPKIKAEINAKSGKPEEMEALEFERLIQEALKDNDYRLAMRYRFLALLYLLVRNKKVRWARDHTNRQYADQIDLPELRGLFQKASGAYETGWYGNAEAGEEQFEYLETLFNGVRSKLQNQPDA